MRLHNPTALALVAALCLLAVACGDDTRVTKPAATQTTMSDEHLDVTRRPGNSFDLLILLDRSPSMCGELRDLGFSIYDLCDTDGDIQVAVLTTDSEQDAQPQHTPQTTDPCMPPDLVEVCGGLGELPPTMNTRNNMKYRDEFGGHIEPLMEQEVRCRMAVGVADTPRRDGLAALKRFFEREAQKDAEARFFRQDTIPVIAIASDFDDCSGLSDGLEPTPENCVAAGDRLLPVDEVAQLAATSLHRPPHVFVLGAPSIEEQQPSEAVCEVERGDGESALYPPMRYQQLARSLAALMDGVTSEISLCRYDPMLLDTDCLGGDVNELCLQLPPDCASDAECPTGSCIDHDVAARRVCEGFEVVVELERPTWLGPYPGVECVEAGCLNPPTGDGHSCSTDARCLRCRLREGVHYAIDWHSSCEPTGIEVSPLNPFAAEDALHIRYLVPEPETPAIECR